MANLIITIISIALVAITVLVGAYYGGQAYSDYSIKVKAQQIINQMVQIKAAANLWQSDNAKTYPGTGDSAAWHTALLPYLSGTDGGTNILPPPAIVKNFIEQDMLIETSSDGVPYVVWHYLPNDLSATSTTVKVCQRINDVYPPVGLTLDVTNNLPQAPYHQKYCGVSGGYICPPASSLIFNTCTFVPFNGGRVRFNLKI